MKSLIWICLIFLPSVLLGQIDSWQEEIRIPVKENSPWHADVLGSIYVVDKDVLQKYDFNGKLLYSQSIKSLGRISKITSINAMKIVLFSEEQQLIALTDNTLTAVQQVYHLPDWGMEYVTHIAVSNQPNKLWVLDQINSKLSLVDLGNTDQSQEVSNLKGLVDWKEIQWMQELDGQLFLRDSENKLFVFDRYGTLMRTFEESNNLSFVTFQNREFLIHSAGIVIFPRNDKTEFSWPLKQIAALDWNSPHLVVESEGFLIKFKRNLGQ